MKNLKKALSLLVVVSMMLAIMLPAVASSELVSTDANSASSFVYDKEAIALNQLGLFAGVSTESFQPDLGSNLTREQAVTLLLRLFGEDQTALAMTDDEANIILSAFDDSSSISNWAKKFVAYVATKGIVVGYISETGRTFKPQQIVSGEEYCAMLAKKMGYTSFVFGDAANGAVQTVSKADGLTTAEAAVFATKSALTRDDFVGISFKALKAKGLDGLSVLEKLAAAKTTAEKATFVEGLKLLALTMPEVVNSIAGVMQKVDPTIQVVLPGAVNAQSVTAVNGTLTVVLSATPSVVPALVDFVITKSIYAGANGAVGTAEVTEQVLPTALSYADTTKTVTLTVPQVPVASTDKSVVYGVAFKGTAKVNAAAFVVSSTQPQASTVQATADSTHKITVSGNTVNATTVDIVINNGTTDVVTQAGVAVTNSAFTYTTTNAMAAGTYTCSVTPKSGIIAGSVATASVTIAASTDLLIESVVATNLHQVVVKFNQEVDETTAERTGYYTGVGTVNTAVLQSDKKTVILNLDAALSQDTEYTVTVKDVMNTALAKTLAEVDNKIKVNDSTIPTVKSVTVLGNKGLRVEFSEPVQATAAKITTNYSFVNETIGISAVSLDDTTGDKTFTVATVQLSDVLTPGEHKFRVNGSGSIKDFANYAVPAQDFVLNITLDTAAPTVSDVKANSRTEVQLAFSKPIQSLAAADILWNTNGSTTSGTSSNSITKIDDSNYKATFTSSTVLPVGNVYVLVKNTNLTDYSSNKMAANYTKQIAVASETVPAVTAVTVSDDKTFYVYFNKSIKDEDSSVGARGKANYTFKTSAGVTLTSTDSSGIDSSGHPIATVTYSDDEKKVTLSLGTYPLSGASYKLTISGIQDALNQTMTTATFDLAVTDKTPATVKAASFSNATDAKTIVVDFSEAMATTGAYSILNASNYRYRTSVGAGDGKLPSGTTLEVFNSNKSVRILFPDASTIASTNVFQIGYIDGAAFYTVADASSNLYTPDADGLTLAGRSATDKTSTVIKVREGTGSIESPTQVKFVALASAPAFNDSTLTASDFVFSTDNNITTTDDNFTATSITLDTSDTSNHTVLFTIPDGNKFDSASAVYVLTLASADSISTKDVYGNKVYAADSNHVITNSIKPVMKAAVVKSATQLAVCFDTKIAHGDYSKLASELIVKQGDHTYTASELGTPASLSTATDDSCVVFTLTDASFSVSDPVTVKTIGQDYITAKGVNGAVIAANTTGITSAGLAAVSVTFSNYASANVLDVGDSIAIGYNANVDFKSIDDVDWTGSIEGITATLNATDGTLTFSGVNIGTISGLNVTTGGDITVSLTKTSDRILTVIVTAKGTPTPVVGSISGLVSLESSGSVKTYSGTVAINTDFEPTTATNF